MASGLVMCRINRPNIWLHRPAKITKKYPCQNGAVHIGPFSACRRPAAYGGTADGCERHDRQHLTPSGPEQVQHRRSRRRLLRSTKRRRGLLSALAPASFDVSRCAFRSRLSRSNLSLAQTGQKAKFKLTNIIRRVSPSPPPGLGYRGPQ
jgi:hypothetical protein